MGFLRLWPQKNGTMARNDPRQRKSAAQYRHFAEQCERKASLTQNPRERDLLRETVQRWLKLAEKTEKLEAKTKAETQKD